MLSQCSRKQSASTSPRVQPWFARGGVSLLALALVVFGCQGPRARWQAQQGLLRTQQLYAQNRQLQMQSSMAQGSLGEMQQSVGALAAERQQLAEQNEALRRNLDVATQRLDNLSSANSNLEDRYRNLLTSVKTGDNPLTTDAIERFKDLQNKYPEFEFDPQTGVSKFHSDLLFASGSDALRPDGVALLNEFAEIMNRADSQHLNILCVGHTDDKPILRSATRNEHPTNLHLSTNRANSVALTLKKAGVAEHRMGSAGYGPHQPLAPNVDEKSRQMNRRVEIFVLAPDAVVAGWDPNGRVR